MLSRNRLSLLDGKIHDKSPDHLFDLNFFDSMLHTIVFQASVQSFFDFSCRSALKKFFLSAVLFFSTSAPVFPLVVLQTLSLLFLCKLIWEGKRNSTSS